MPDWSFHPVFKPLLKRMKPDVSRELTLSIMNRLAILPGGRRFIGFLGHMSPPEQMKRKLHGLSFPSPIGLGSIVDPRLSGLSAFQSLGVGFIEIGPIAINGAKQGESKQSDQTILFSREQEKVPLKKVISKLVKEEVDLPIIARIDSFLSADECKVITEHLTPYVEGFIMTERQLEDCLSDSTFNQTRAIFCSYNTEIANEKRKSIATMYKNGEISGVVIDAPKIEVAEYWCESDRAVNELSKEVSDLRKAFPNITIITSGGIQEPKDAWLLHEAGADLTMLGIGYVNAGPGLPKRIHEYFLYKTEEEDVAPYHWSFIFGLLIFLGGVLATLFGITRVLLPYDEAFIGLQRSEIMNYNPNIIAFMAHDRISLAGTMLSGGFLYMQLARHGIKRRLHWARVTYHTAAIIGFLGILLFLGFGYFDWLHGLFWLVLFPIYMKSVFESKHANQHPSSQHATNDRKWKRALVGQLFFIILGLSIIIGGIVISTIGVTNVFVSTDLLYLCLTEEMLHQISEQLIPVIAHDRAGFGSALISVGILVFFMSLWGFRQGEKWVWNTLALGALPAFIAGLGIHFVINYTNFIHLIPVYFLILLYVLGLFLTFSFLKNK